MDVHRVARHMRSMGSQQVQVVVQYNACKLALHPYCVWRRHRKSMLRTSEDHTKGPMSQGHGATPFPSSSSHSRKSSSHASSSILQQDGHQLAQLLRRLSDLQVQPHQQWLQEVLHTLEPQLAGLTPAELSGCFKVLGSWAYTPSDQFMQQLVLAAMLHIQQQRCNIRHLGDIAWGLAKLHNPKHPLLDKVMAAASSLVMSHGRSSGSSPTADDASKCPQHLVAGSLADLVWSVAELQHNPGQAWLDNFAAASGPLLQRFTPKELAQVVWAFDRLPYQPEQAWVDQYLAAVQDHLTEFDAKSLSLTAYGLAKLRLKPSVASSWPRWLFAFERQAERTLGKLQAGELACTLWALSELKSKRAHELRLGRLVRRQEVFWPFDYQLLANPKLLRVVRSLTLGPQEGGSR
eukprot:GHRR01013551.1.p1 GENE.GHRR01013551.1~~GHRR01013551.1.p1  ORF type:complete len:406 (+),score=117.24 GHRR01013551.1:317-1534(+)